MKDLDLNITLEFGLKEVDYLDTNMSLNTGEYKPYRKPNDKPVYSGTCLGDHSTGPRKSGRRRQVVAGDR